MSFQEKSAWLMLGVVTFVYGWYFIDVLGQVDDTPLADIAYRGEMLGAVIVLVVLSIVGHIIAAVTNPSEAEKTDERDREINRYGEYVGGFALGAGALVALFMAMFEFEYFWIANVILGGLVLSEVVSNAVQVALYRRGF